LERWQEAKDGGRGGDLGSGEERSAAGRKGPVGDSPLVEVGDGGEHLARQLGKACLSPYEGQVAVGPNFLAIDDGCLHEEVEEIAALAHFQDQMQAVFFLEDLVELYDIRVVQHFHDANLVPQEV
jgi:hypothetical protein